MNILHTITRCWLIVAVLVIPAHFAGAAGTVAIESPRDSTVSYRDRLTVIARGQADRPITLTANGRMISTLTVRPDLKADFLNIPAPAGPVTLVVRQELSSGIVEADSMIVHVIGPAAKVLAHIMPASLPADSVSQADVDISVTDAWGMPLPDGQIVTLKLDNGIILNKDLYPEEPGIQVHVRSGQASARIQAPAVIGEGNLTVVADGVSTEVSIGYTAPYEKMILVGMVTGQIGKQTTKSTPAGAHPGSDFKNGTVTSGKAAFFARGSIGKGFLLSSSYDSDRKYTDRVFRYLTPERVFPIYGDASSIFYEAPTASRLFLRIDKNRSFLQYGDFTTGLSQAELTAYNRTFTGVSSAGKSEHLSWNLFGAMTEQSIQVDEIPGEGVSGQYYLSASRRGVPVLDGSERVVIQTRDRLHPENIVREEMNYRFTDYEIDYASATLIFKRPVPARSADENPIYIVVTYETARAFERHAVGGGRMALHAGDALEIGTTVVGEEKTERTEWLAGIDARVRAGGGVLFNSEYARSSGDRDGYAWKIGAQGKIRTAFDYDLYYRTANRDFINPSSTTAYPGVRKMRGRFSWTPWSMASINGEAYQQEDTINREDRLSTTLGGSYRWGTLTASSSLELMNAERQNVQTRSSIMNTGLEWAATRRLTLGAERDQNFGDEDINYRPTLNRLHARWALTDRIDFVLEHAFRDKSFTDSSFTAVGIQSPLSENLTAYANYKLDGGMNGRKNEAIVGLRHKYRPHPDITFNTSFERMQTLRGNRMGDFFAYTLAGEYLPPESFKASARFEQREGKTLDKTMASGAFDLVIGRNLSLLAKHTFLDEGNMAAGARSSMRTNHFLSGLAWRPTAGDKLNALGKYEFKRQFNGLTATSSTRMVHIGSIEMILEPISQIEWFARYACKVSQAQGEDITSRSFSDLWMTSIRYELLRKWDILGEYRILRQQSSHDNRYGIGIETGYVIMKDARIAIGYNIAGYQDDDFAGASYWARGPYAKIQMKFTESDVAALLNGLQMFKP